MSYLRSIPTFRARRGFTLVELLVVIGVMAVVATMIGVGLSRGGDGAALSAAQNMMMSQIAATRAQAALRGASAALVVVDDPTEPADSRRVVGVAADDAGLWRLIADPVRLPGGVGIAESGQGQSPWRTAFPVAFGLGDGTVSCWAIEFEADGSLVNAGGGVVWLGLGETTPSGWRSTTEGSRRGLQLSRYGAIRRVDQFGGVE